MSRGPVGPDREELLVGCSGFFVFPAIAEHPSAQIGDFFFFGLQIEGTAGALDCNIAAPLMVERLTQLAIDPGALVIRNIAPPEINQACLEVARKSRANDGLPDLANVAQLGDNLGVAGRVSPGESWRFAALGEIAAGCASLAIAASAGPSAHVWSDPHLLKCASRCSSICQNRVNRAPEKPSVACTLQEFLHLINKSKGSL